MFCSKDREVVPKLCRMPSTSTRAWKVKGASAVLKVQANRLGQKWLEPYMIYIIYIYIYWARCAGIDFPPADETNSLPKAD